MVWLIFGYTWNIPEGSATCVQSRNAYHPSLPPYDVCIKVFQRNLTAFVLGGHKFFWLSFRPKRHKSASRVSYDADAMLGIQKPIKLSSLLMHSVMYSVTYMLEYLRIVMQPASHGRMPDLHQFYTDGQLYPNTSTAVIWSIDRNVKAKTVLK